MKSVTSKNRLRLTRETLRTLTPEELVTVGGASVLDVGGCRPLPSDTTEPTSPVNPVRTSNVMAYTCGPPTTGPTSLTTPIGGA